MAGSTIAQQASNTLEPNVPSDPYPDTDPNKRSHQPYLEGKMGNPNTADVKRRDGDRRPLSTPQIVSRSPIRIKPPYPVVTAALRTSETLN